MIIILMILDLIAMTQVMNHSIMVKDRCGVKCRSSKWPVVNMQSQIVTVYWSMRCA